MRRPDVRAASSPVPTAVHFASVERGGWTLDARLAELESWRGRLGDPAGRESYLLDVIASLAAEQATLASRPSRRVAELFLRRARPVKAWWRTR
jgi:hypothetical protein